MITPISSTCIYHVSSNIPKAERATQRKIARRRDGRATQRLRRVIAIIVTGPAAGVTTPAKPADDRTKQNWIFISDDNATRSSPPLLCFPLQQASGPAKPLPLFLFLFLSLILSFSLAFLFISHLPLLLHLCHYCFVATRMHTRPCERYHVCAPYPFPSNKTVHRLWIRDWLLFRKYNAPTDCEGRGTGRI